MAELPVVGGYEIRRGLGRGAMGSVYLGYDPKLDREVAVKILQKDFAQSPKHRQRFEREARAIAALRHPNIVKIYDYGGSPEKYLYLVMEYVSGPHAGKLCREHGTYPETVLLAVGLRLADALAEAHAAGIIHRDIKPENVFLEGGRVVLGDFGIVKAITENNPLGKEAASPMTEVIGTPGFMAPEQLEGKPLDERTDIFAFGALLYYLGCKKLPFDADSPYELMAQFRDERPLPLIERRPELSESVSRLIQDCLEVNPKARPRTIREVHRGLREALEELGGRDPRELIEGYLKNPERFRREDRQHVVKHLVGRLKVAVRDEDGVAANAIRTRLAILDPNNSDAMRVSGVTKLIRRIRREGRGRRWWPLVATLLATGMVGATLYLTRSTEPREPPQAPVAAVAPQPHRPAPTLLQVRATDRTHVFVDGRALGHTPDFASTEVPSGEVEVELVHRRRGRLKRTIKLEPGQATTVVVDWRRKRVQVENERPTAQ